MCVLFKFLSKSVSRRRLSTNFVRSCQELPVVLGSLLMNIHFLSLHVFSEVLGAVHQFLCEIKAIFLLEVDLWA